MASLPSDRTKLGLAQGNQVPNSVIASAKNINAVVEVYDTVDLLNQKVDANYGTGAIGTNQLATDSVTLVKMANASVGTTELVDSSVTLAKMADASVGTTELVDLSVTTAKIALASVGVAQLSPGATVNESVNNALIVAFQGEWVNVKQMPSPYVSAVGNGTTDDTAAIQAAITNFKTIHFPVGTYLISDTLREATNGGARQIIGENQMSTIIKAAASMTNKPLIWFGNSNGHGNYRGHIKNISLDGYAAASGNIGIRWHEAGTSITRDVFIANCVLAIQALGCIAHTIDGNTYIMSCTQGIVFSAITAGTPSSVNDITVTASPLTLRGNISKIKDAWFTAITNEAVIISGGLFSLQGCTFQSCTTAGANYDVVTLLNANESFDYGGGPIVQDCWFEGGSYRYAIAVRNTKCARIRDCFISGSNSADGTKEGAILLSNADFSSVKGVSMRGTFNRAPSEARLANAGIYVTQNTRLYTCNVDENYLTTNELANYFEGVPTPSIRKPRQPHWATISISAGVGTVVDASSDIIASLTRASAGAWVVAYKSNKEIIAGSQCAVLVMALSSTVSKTYSASVYIQAANKDQISFFTNGNVAEDPLGFTIMFFSEFQEI